MENEHVKGHITHHNDHPTIGDEVGEAAGGISGVVAGAAIGSAAGPVGTVIGGIAGALGGWWAGRAISETAKHYTQEDDSYYRNQYDNSPNKLADTSYDQVKPAYQVGHMAGRNPEYAGKTFDTVETDLRRGWDNGGATIGRDWDKVKHYAREAYDRSTNMTRDTGLETDSSIDTGTSRTAARTDDVFDRADPNRRPITPEGPDATNGGVRY
jgi:hypothetical protein